MEKFLYVFSKSARDSLLAANYTLLKSDEQNAGGEYHDAENGFFNGWEFGQYTTTVKVIIEVVEVDGKITVRQKK